MPARSATRAIRTSSIPPSPRHATAAERILARVPAPRALERPGGIAPECGRRFLTLKSETAYHAPHDDRLRPGAGPHRRAARDPGAVPGVRGARDPAHLAGSRRGR